MSGKTAEKTQGTSGVPGIWTLPNWLNWPLGLFQRLLSVATGALGMLACLQGLPGRTIYFPLGMAIGLLLIYVAVAIHEGGHLLAARRAGMVVLQAGVGFVEFRALRKGWRVGWRRQVNKRQGGYVMAFADPRQDWRRQSMGFVVGGPLANLLAAGLGWLLLPYPGGSFSHALLLAFVATNACMGLANLVPARVGALETDGLWLLRWWRGLDPRHPQLAYVRVLGLGCAGVCADQLPAEELQNMQAQAQPLPLLSLFIRLRALMLQDRWQEAVALEQCFVEQRDALAERLRLPLFDLLKLMAAELAFAKAVLGDDAALLADDLLPVRLQRRFGSFWARCLALRALRLGDSERYRQQLDTAVAFAGQSPDLSQEREELRLREHILARLPG